MFSFLKKSAVLSIALVLANAAYSQSFEFRQPIRGLVVQSADSESPFNPSDNVMVWDSWLSKAGVGFSEDRSVATFSGDILVAVGPQLPTYGKVYWEVELTGSAVAAGAGSAPFLTYIGDSSGGTTYPLSCGMYIDSSNIATGSRVTAINSSSNGSGNVFGFAYDGSLRRLDIYRGGVHEGYCIFSGNEVLYIVATNRFSTSSATLRNPSQLSFSPPPGYLVYGTPGAMPYFF
jgi:hypothetical protein